MTCFHIKPVEACSDIVATVPQVTTTSLAGPLTAKAVGCHLRISARHQTRQESLLPSVISHPAGAASSKQDKRQTSMPAFALPRGSVVAVAAAGSEFP